jgi:hypothetical protein
MSAAKLKARDVAKSLTPAVNAVLMARVFAESERERVDDIARKVLSEQNYYGRKDYHSGDRITDPKKSWLLDDQSFATYHAKMQAIHLANGFADAAKGFCPALVAEEVERQAEHVLIECAAEFFPGVTVNALLCGTKERRGLECYKHFIDLCIGLVVNSPGYRNPLTGKIV